MGHRLLFILCLLWSGLALADEDLDGWGDEGDDAGFADTPDIKVGVPSTPSALSINGFIRSRAGAWVERLDHQPVSTLRQSLDLTLTYRQPTWRAVVSGHGEYDPAYTAINTEEYSDQIRDSYGYRFLHGDQYLAFSLGDSEWTLGRQTVAWGEGDFFSLLDVTNPRDLREPGLADLDDLRLPVLATRMAYFADWGRLEVMVSHETNQGERPPPFSEYSPFRSVLARDPVLGQILSTRTLEYSDSPDRFHQGFSSLFVRYLRKAESVDVGVYAAWLRDPQGVLSPPEGFELLGNALSANLDPMILDGLIPARIDLDFEYPRYLLLGHTGSWAQGLWVFKYELVGEINRTWNTADLTLPVPVIEQETASRVSILGSASYNAGDDTMVSAEAIQGVLINAPKNVLFPTDAPQIGLRYSRQYLRQTLRLDVAGSVMGVRAEYGWFARSELTYDVMDALKAGLMFVHYGTGDADEVSLFSGMGEHDQLFVKLRWDFQVH